MVAYERETACAELPSSDTANDNCVEPVLPSVVFALATEIIGVGVTVNVFEGKLEPRAFSAVCRSTSISSRPGSAPRTNS